MKEIFKIAIDGPSGAGKSTIAKAVAKRLGIDYIDTGAMYRAIGLKMTRLNLPMEESEALQQMLEETDIDFNAGDVILDDVVVNDLIRTPEMSMAHLPAPHWGWSVPSWWNCSVRWGRRSLSSWTEETSVKWFCPMRNISII